MTAMEIIIPAVSLLRALNGEPHRAKQEKCRHGQKSEQAIPNLPSAPPSLHVLTHSKGSNMEACTPTAPTAGCLGRKATQNPERRPSKQGVP
jgi:hypothetical protein